MNLLKKSYLLLVVFFCECTSNSHITDLNSVPAIQLKGVKQNLSDKVLSPRKIFVMEDGCLYYDSADRTGFLKFEYFSSGKILKYGVLGRGNNEFINPTIHRSDVGNVVLTSINSNNMILSYTGDSLLMKPLSLKDEKKLVGVNFLALDQDFLVYNSNSDSQISIFDTKNNTVVTTSFYPFNINGYSDFELANILFDSNMSYSSDNHSLFILYKYYPYAMTVNIKEQKVLNSVEVVGALAQNNYRKNEKGVVEFISPTLFYTYSLNAGNSKWGLFQNSTREQLSKRVNQSEIHQFTSHRDLQRRFILDRTIYHFDVSPDCKYIYALALTSEGKSEMIKYVIS